jgi:hypothetical protein
MAETEIAKKRAADSLILKQSMFKHVLMKEDNDSGLPPVAEALNKEFWRNLDAVMQQDTAVNVQVSNYRSIYRIAC